MKIANGIEIMEIQINSMGRKTIIYPTLMWDNETVILFDAGMANSLPQLNFLSLLRAGDSCLNNSYES